MRVFISHASALAFWRSDYAQYGKVRPCRIRSLDGAAASLAELATFDVGERFGAAPLHLLVADPCRRNADERHHSHLWRGHIPTGSFVALDGGIYVCSPELTFLQCALGLDCIEAALLGYELCGGYSLRPDADMGFVSHEPLTSVGRIRDYAAKLAVARRPSRRVARILGLMRDGSASPAETAMAMRLALPLRMGGCSVDDLVLNYEVEVAGAALGLTSSSRLYCDAYLPKHQVDIEYESAAFHTGRRKLVEDSERRAALASMGITVVTVTPNQLYSLKQFSTLANHIRKLCGKRPFELTTDRLVAQDRLCGLVLSGYRRRYVG